jgi:protocatechuate 3,4-dioxygenase, alpha subunit
VRPGRTPSQTVGPFFALGLPWPAGPEVVPKGTPGAMWIRGRVLDGDGSPVPDALIETWQADPDGGFAHAYEGRKAAEPASPIHGFRGFGRCPTDAGGGWEILTVKPGRVPAPDSTQQAPHLAVAVFARGLLNHLFTRIYFCDEEEANATDPVLSRIQDPNERATLIAQPVHDGYEFDIRLQGDHETVFFHL